jgi:hypothetical protein
MEIKAKSRTKESPLKSERQGFIKRFLKWIAKGADQARIVRGTCPT